MDDPGGCCQTNCTLAFSAYEERAVSLAFVAAKFQHRWRSAKIAPPGWG